jgi:FixJ family two-component response regulator
MITQWADMLSQNDWERIVSILKLSRGQADFLWHALHDSRDTMIATKMSLSQHGAHAHRVAVFRKLKVDSMPAAIARVFAAYVIVRNSAAHFSVDSRATARIPE